MKVLVVGGGGREHALAWKLSQSSRISKLWCTPGNAGIAGVAECVDISAENIDGLLQFSQEQGVELAVIGPEAPLVAGIGDRFAEAGVPLFGPNADGARLEGSKAFAKDLMRRNAIPTAPYRVFEQLDEALDYCQPPHLPLAVKADGLAAGKGVVICRKTEEAETALREMMLEKRFGDAGAKVVVEDLLHGTEASLLAITDGRTIVSLPSAQDHKRAFDGGEGPNTGGMGALSPAPALTPEMTEQVEREILVPLLHGLRIEGIEYRGVIYAGLMIGPSGPRVLEFNVRFGDPEIQPILLRMRSDLLELLLGAVQGTLDRAAPDWSPDPAVALVLASGGYPGSYTKGAEISGLDESGGVHGATVFHAGTARRDGQWVTAGGRVMAVTATAPTVAAARDQAYSAAGRISWEGMHYRKDIAL